MSLYFMCGTEGRTNHCFSITEGLTHLAGDDTTFTFTVCCILEQARCIVVNSERCAGAASAT